MTLWLMSYYSNPFWVAGKGSFDHSSGDYAQELHIDKSSPIYFYWKM